MASPDPGAAPAADEDSPDASETDRPTASEPTASERLRLMLAILASELGVGDAPGQAGDATEADDDASTQPRPS